MIIVIDDNKDLSYITCELLKVSGFDCIDVNSGEEGIKKAKELMPAVIICDIGMPGMNGYDVVKFIRGDVNLKNTYMIAMSGYCSEKDRLLSKEAGFDMHLEKPVEIGTLTKILSRHFGHGP